MGCDKVDRPVSADSWAESQMSHHTLSEAFSGCYNEIRAFQMSLGGVLNPLKLFPRWFVLSAAFITGDVHH